jgi:ABC-type enterochelin transport system substrate-binding protein
MSANYERIKGERGRLEGFLGKVPGYKGYKEKEMRRESDRLLRDALVRDFSEQLNRLTPMQSTLIDNGAIDLMDEMGAVKTALQTLIDRIRYAPQGYAGFFDAVRVKEDDLERLETFDQQLVAEIAKVSTAFDNLDKAVQANAEIKPAISQARAAVQDVSTLFNKRSSVITGL